MLAEGVQDPGMDLLSAGAWSEWKRFAICEVRRVSAAMWRRNLRAREHGAVTRRGMPAADAVTHSVTLGGIARWYLQSRPVVELDALIG